MADDGQGSDEGRVLEFPGQKFVGQRPPFEAGHTLSMTHGAHSPRVVVPRAEQLVKDVLAHEATPDYLKGDASYLPAIHAWARAEVQVQLLADWLSAKSIEEQLRPPRAGVLPPLEVLRKWEQTAAGHRARLGLDPMSRARLQRDLVTATAIGRGAGLVALAESGAAAMDRARARGAVTDGSDGDDGDDGA